jgi:hypothetical protein
MNDRVHNPPGLIFSPGTKVVTLHDVLADGDRVIHAKGSVAEVAKAPADPSHSYRVRFADGFEASVGCGDIVMLAHYQEGDIDERAAQRQAQHLFDRVLYRCVIGSRAYGLDDEASDTDRRGVYLPTAAMHWSLYGVPEQLENDTAQEAYWELQKFIVLALKANPNILECLYTPLVEKATPLAEELLAMRSVFLSRLIYQTFNGYVLSQFRKMQADLRQHGRVKWKHVMHLIRLLISGTTALREGIVPVRVDDIHRGRLLAIKRGEMPWEETEAWRLALHRDFDAAFDETKLPERPDYVRANDFLLKARRLAAERDDLP